MIIIDCKHTRWNDFPGLNMKIGKPSPLPCSVDFTPDSCKVRAHVPFPHATLWFFSREVAGVTMYLWMELGSVVQQLP